MSKPNRTATAEHLMKISTTESRAKGGYTSQHNFGRHCVERPLCPKCAASAYVSVPRKRL